jgi:hypothetical protein
MRTVDNANKTSENRSSVIAENLVGFVMLKEQFCGSAVSAARLLSGAAGFYSNSPFTIPGLERTSE